MKLSELEPAGYNPRSISPEAMAGLDASLRRFGMVQPIVWNKTTGRIVGGHQRHRALMDAGETEAHVVVVQLDDAEEKALNVALNNPHISGEFTDELQQLLQEIAEGDPLGFSELRLDELYSEAVETAPEIEEWTADAITVPEGVVVFIKVGHDQREQVETLIRDAYPDALIYSHLDFSDAS